MYGDDKRVVETTDGELIEIPSAYPGVFKLRSHRRGAIGRLDFSNPLDELYFLGCADCTSEIWCRYKYNSNDSYLLAMRLILNSRHSTQDQKEAAQAIIERTLAEIEAEEKKRLCALRRAEFARNYEPIKLALIARDGYGCVECGAQDNMTIDHIIPLSKGGTDKLDNLRFLCSSCNSKKKDRLDFSDIESYDFGELENANLDQQTT